ncbi:unnamed protein product [Cylindrotheca closterium]|uniref:Uncharacterized protein n=1 Tax=Cylindrotheca closterium TaxID=2856 RepID=A0AAD2FGZ1_9STRA|nr:unnamed protein product [Cylindrotheca closterium]
MEHWASQFVEPTIRTNNDNTKPWNKDMSYLRASPPKQIRAPATEQRDEPAAYDVPNDIPSLSQSTSSLSLSVTDVDRERTTPTDITDNEILQGAAMLKAQLLKEQEELIQQEARYMASPQSTPGRSREYNNSAYFSDTEDEDEQDDYNVWGIEKATPSHFSFVDVNNDGKWAEFSNQDNVFTKTPQGHFSSNESRASKLSSSPDAYIDRPPKRSINLGEKKLPQQSIMNDIPSIESHRTTASKEPGVADAAYAMFMSGTPMSSYAPPRTNTQTSPSRVNTSSTSKPQSPPKSYPLSRNQSAISAAESDALDFLASQFSTEVEPVAPIRKKTESPIKPKQAKKVKKKEPGFPLVVKPMPMPGDLAQSVVSPFTKEYRLLLKDPGYLHAQGAGTLWQSLVSQHVKFPSKWFNGSRAPPMGLGERRLWQYIGRHRVGGDKALNLIVNNRGAAGRILMHIVVKEESTLAPALDVAIGCFHPNARGVRTTAAFEPILEDCRDIWLATRRRFPDDLDVENSLRYQQEKNATLGDSPLGPKHAVNNTNMRAIFGEKPPLQTIFVLESELKKILIDQVATQDMPPSLVLLQRYLKLL